MAGFLQMQGSVSLSAAQPSNSSVVRCSDSGSGQSIWLQGCEIRSRQSRSCIRGWWPSALSLSAKTVLASTELENDHVFVSFWSFRLPWESGELLVRLNTGLSRRKNNPVTVLDLGILGAEALILGGEQICSGVFPLLPPYTSPYLPLMACFLRKLLHVFFRLPETKNHLYSPGRYHSGLSVKPSWRWSFLINIRHDSVKSHPAEVWDQNAVQAISVSPISRKFVCNFITSFLGQSSLTTKVVKKLAPNVLVLWLWLRSLSRRSFSMFFYVQATKPVLQQDVAPRVSCLSNVLSENRPTWLRANEVAD